MSPRRQGPGRDADALLALRLRRRHRARRKNRRRRISRLIVGGILGVLLVLVVSGFTGAAVWMASCDLNSLRAVSVGQNSFVYAADGSLLGSIPAEKNRQPVALSGGMSKWVSRATVAIEDRRYWSHGALDYPGIVRALFANIRAGHVVQGGSTITQQLARNLYIKKPSQTFGRKATEACLAIKLARKKSRAWILQTYINQVFYGNRAYGIEAAAQTYFSKRAKHLTLPEAALLAGLPQAPSVFDPFERPQQAIARRDEVLRAMLANHYITATQYADTVADRDLHLRAGRLYTRIREPYFFSYVREELQKKYGSNTVRSGGLKVYTTIDPRLQRLALEAIRQTLPYKTDPAAAIVSINPVNGAIRAMTEVSPGDPKNQVNFASSARRQPGSTFKTIVLTTAISQGISPSTTYLSAPFKYDPTNTGSCDTDPPTAWCPQTYDHTYIGATSIENGTLRSDNSVYARLSLDVGPENIAAIAYKLGVRTDLRTSDGAYVPSMGLGSRVVTPMDMASVYSTMAAGGIYSKPMAIRKVVLAGGQVDRESGWGVPQRKRVIADWVAAEVRRILEENMTQGTGTGAYFGKLSAGKTGTTDNYADAWFCGFTPALEATVWIGYPRGEIPMRSVHGISVSGPTFPATIWKLFMERAVAYAPSPKTFPVPKTSPIWRSRTLQYALQGGYSSSSSSSSSGSSSGYSTPSQTETQQGNDSDGFVQIPDNGNQP
jgi:penicillin-binding protein 1A